MGAELAGALKNIIALGSGILGGMGMGKNIQAMLITRGLTEMIHYGKAMGSTARPFLGIAGIGDLVATATSDKSRNYTFGYRIGQGEAPEDIFRSMRELAEGARTLKIARGLAKHYKLHVPITTMLYNVVFEGFDKQRATGSATCSDLSEDFSLSRSATFRSMLASFSFTTKKSSNGLN